MRVSVRCLGVRVSVVSRECGVEGDALKVRLELHKVGPQRFEGPSKQPSSLGA